MKLVDYLRALLSQFVSKNDTAFISHQAMPNTSDNSVEIAEDEWVATADGAIRIYVNDKPTDNGNFINIRDSKGFILQQVLYSLNEGGYKTIWQPVTKGMKYKMEHKFTDTTPKYFKTFFKTMGGVISFIRSEVSYAC